MKVNNPKIAFVSGNFNILHPGHLRLFRFAKEMSDKLVVAVYSDRLAGSAAHIPQDMRLESLQSNSWVDEAIIIDKPVAEVIREMKPDFVIKGKEHEGGYNSETEAVAQYGGKLVFSSGDATFSSFDLIRKELGGAQIYARFPAEYLKRHSLDWNQLVERVHQFNSLKIVVIGDIIVDEYITCDPLGMSQEDPTIVVTPVEAKKFIGGAGIVAAHAAGLGADVTFLSVTGNDELKQYVQTRLGDFGVRHFLYTDESRPTTLKQRYRCKGKTLLRVSKLHQGSIDHNIQEAILSRITELLENCDLLIFSDFNYGCLPTEMVQKIIEAGKKKNVLMVADSQSSSQVGDISRFTDMALLTPTEREARLSVWDSESGLVVLAEKLRQRAGARNILLKIGEDGVLIHAETHDSQSWLTDRIPALNAAPVDVAGAGDSMLIASAMALACNASIWEAAALGSLAAAIQVSRVGNIPLRSSELLQQLQR